MKLKEGMYIRTKLNDFCNMVAIRKIDEIDYEDNDKFWIDRYIVDTFGDEQNKLSEEDVDIASFDITDLITKGDYVNGSPVSFIERHENGKTWIYTDSEYKYGYLKEEIKTVATREEFYLIEYEVE